MNKNQLVAFARMGLESRLRELQQEVQKVKDQLAELDAENRAAPGPRASPIEPVEERPLAKRTWSLRQRRRFLKTMRRKRAEKEG
jgi:hypothetical protein